MTCMEVFIHLFFSASPMLTDNGLATQDYKLAHAHDSVLLSSSFFGGCIGSTCGGIKSLISYTFQTKQTRDKSAFSSQSVVECKCRREDSYRSCNEVCMGVFFFYTLFTVFFYSTGVKWYGI